MRANRKPQRCHLARSAYLYVRQATLPEGFENTGSTQRQYVLKQRAVALGWRADKIVVIDSDFGKSAALASGREGFQRLLTQISLGRVGIVMALDVSRLTRNSTDWHRLLESCAQTDTLILLEDEIYDLADLNDSLLLGLKEIISRGCGPRGRRRRPSKSA